MTKVTIVTVCYNCLDLLKKTMVSVFQQSYRNIEYIVIDGNSIDGTQQYLSTVKCNFLRWFSEPDKGIYDAMNKAIDKACGDYLIFLNAGDVFATSNILSRVFATSTTADVLYGSVLRLQNKRIIEKKAEKPHNSHRMFFCHQSAFTKVSLLKSLRFDDKYLLSADFKMYKILWKENASFERLDFPIAIYDMNGISNTRRADGLKENIAIVKELDVMPEKLILLCRLYFTYFVQRLRSFYL